jgi:hypothetical protein
MEFALLLNTVALLIATGNIFLMIKIFSQVTPVAEAPRAWSLMAFGLGMIVIHLSMNLFLWVNPVLRSSSMHYLSAAAGIVGFAGLFLGAKEVHEVISV